MFDSLADIVSKIGVRSNPKITKEWILNNLSINKMLAFLSIITSSIDETTEAKEQSETPAKN